MKLRTNEASGASLTGIAETETFRIKTTGKAFKILIDGLYQDKIAAVIRELSTNAYDAHLALGKGDEPFLVQFPTAFEPTFRVRDYGVSMTHEQTMRLLSTLFDSSKDNANNAVGAFGLGSKSPFALVDSYNITVWKDGRKRAYSAYFDAGGVPALSLMDDSPSDEPQGVEFSFPVNPKDASAFAERGRRILRWFPTIPTLQGMSGTIAKPEALISGNGWSLLKKEIVNNLYSPLAYRVPHETPQAMARQGCVVYPINPDAIPNIPARHRELLQARLLLDFPIGTLEVAASREALSYDEETCQNILARLNSVERDIREKYAQEVSKASTLWEAGEIVRALMESQSLPHAVMQVVITSPWKGKNPSLRISTDDIRKAVGVANVESVHYWDLYNLSVSQTPRIGDRSRNNGEAFTVVPGEADIRFFFSQSDSRPSYEALRIWKACNKHSGARAVLFVVKDRAAADKILDAVGNPPAERAAWCQDLDLPTMPGRAPSKRATGTTKKTEVKVREISLRPNQKSEVLAEKTVPLDGDALYLLASGGYVIGLGADGGGTLLVSEAVSILSTANEFDLLPKNRPIYLVSVVYEKRVSGFAQWKLADKVLVESTKQTAFADRLAEEARDTARKTYRNRSNMLIRFLLDYRTFLLWTLSRDPTSPIRQLAEALKEGGFDKPTTTVIGHNTALSNLWSMSHLGVEASTLQQNAQRAAEDIAQAELKAERLLTKALKQYPLICAATDTKNESIVREYVEATDLYNLRPSVPAAA